MASLPAALASIPSPPTNGIHVGPLFIHVYGLMYVVGISLAIYITGRRWAEAGGDRSLVYDVALWAVPAGIVGGRIYFDLTTPFDMPHHWWGPFAVWDGGLGIWGGIALAAIVGSWRVHRAGASVGVFMNAVAPALLVAQAVGRIGNYFNQELFGKPSSLPWAVQISYAARVNSGIPAADLKYTTFQPSFLYEMIFDLALAARAGLARPPPEDPAAGPVRAVRGRVLGVPDLRGDDPGRLLGPLPRAAAELLRGDAC